MAQKLSSEFLDSWSFHQCVDAFFIMLDMTLAVSMATNNADYTCF